MRSPSAARRRDEVGQITAMMVILTCCLLLAVIAVADVSASYLRRESMRSLADGAALAATQAAAATSVYSGAGDFIPIDESAARRAVDRYLQETHAYKDFPGLRAEVVVDAYTVRVWLAAPYTLPVAVPGADAAVTVHGSSAAQLPVY
ncbi:MAG: pilus assembly protein TadG-related protein [Nocardioidaceae bacterium]